MNNFFLYIPLSSVMFLSTCQADRSIFRPLDLKKPEIITCWVGSDKTYKLKSYYLEDQALFNKFNYTYFMRHQLPRKTICYRNSKNKKITGQKLHKLAQELVQELYQHKKKFKHFTVIKSQDFNFRTVSGLIVLKYTKHPFIIKLFIETPESFVQPFFKGWQPACFFVMGGGINRYLSGFTRIKNLEIIRKKIKTDLQWSQKLATPRKWFWMPDNCRWFEIRGNNIGMNKKQKIVVPSVYAIIADAITVDKRYDLFNRAHRAFAIKLCHFLGTRIDPHINNFIKEKGTGKTVIIDTEHFPTMVGLRKPLYFTTYSSWYAQLTGKFLCDTLCRTKRYRTQLQTNPEQIIPVTEY
jgi:hypothetical protein